MSVFFYLILGFLLLALNVILVILIKRTRTFAMYPGWIYGIIFTCFGCYLLMLFGSYTSPGPAPVLQTAHKSGGGSTASDQVYLDRYNKAEKNYLLTKNDWETKINESHGTVNVFLNFLALQSAFAFISALVGTRVLKKKAKYYFGFAALHLFLTIITLAAKVLINR